MAIIYFALGLIGFSALTTQVLLLRELLNLFSGNELIYGLTLSAWLLLTAAGSMIGAAFVDRSKNRMRMFISSQLALAFCVPASIVASRAVRSVLNIPVEMSIGLSMSVLITFSILVVPCLVIGFQFTLGSKLLRDLIKEEPRQVGRMYMLESIGSLAGGVLFSFVLIYFFDPFQIAGIIACLLTASALSMYKNYVRKNAKRLLKAGPVLVFALMMALGIILVYPSGQKLDRETLKMAWRGSDIAASEESAYGRITLIRNGSDISFFRNGNLFYSTADTLSGEELMALSFLERPAPQKVLLVGGGIGGALRDAAKFKCHVDYIEYDPKMIELSKKYLAVDDLLDNKLINIVIADGRFFVNTTKNRYDLVIIDAGDPEDAVTNRYYTKEFFDRCSSILNRNGVLGVNLSYSEGYMSPELKGMNSSVYRTISSVFKYVTVIPSNRNYYFASNDNVATESANELIKRWFEHNVPTRYFNVYAIPYIAYPFKIRSVKDAIKFDEHTRMNTDTTPTSYLYGIMLWLKQFPSALNDLVLSSAGMRPIPLLIFIVILSIILRISANKSALLRTALIPLSVFFIGFTGMAGELALIFAFQSYYGNVYSIIGFLLALFMAGLAAGSFIVNENPGKMSRSSLTVINGSLIATLLLIYIYFTAASLQTAMLHYLSIFIIPFFIIALSVNVGAFFPAAIKLSATNKKGLTSIAGILYGYDLFGGALAAVMAGVILIPLFGLSQLVLILAAVTAGALIVSL